MADTFDTRQKIVHMIYTSDSDHFYTVRLGENKVDCGFVLGNGEHGWLPGTHAAMRHMKVVSADGRRTEWLPIGSVYFTPWIERGFLWYQNELFVIVGIKNERHIP